MSDIELDYEYLTQKALRHLIADVLQITADLGHAPGEHHFYIEFFTQAPGVEMPAHLRDAYPERMTIVLQHQFENLSVDEDGFFVSLWFKRKQSDMRIPFDAVASFADPSVQFMLRFEQAIDAEPSEKDAKPALVEPKSAPEESPETQSGDGADVVSLDSFRKK